MTDSDTQRLPSPHLEDLAFIVLSARGDGEGFSLYPDMSDETRTRLRSRIKQLSRYDWPSSLREDPAFRRGLTLRQCLRLSVTLLLLDAHLPPSLAVMLAQNNELGFLRVAAEALEQPAAGTDGTVAVILATEIQEALGFPDRILLEEQRVRFIRRNELAQLWTDDLAGSGARLIVDIATAATALWRWISERRLMNDLARVELLRDVANASDRAGFERNAERRLRR